MKKAFLAILLFSASHAAAGDWYFVTSDINDDKIYFMDVSSISTEGPTRKVWTNVESRDQTSVKLLWGFKCGSKTSALFAYIEYDKNENVAKSDSQERPSFQPVAPDTLSDALLRATCAPSSKAFLSKQGFKAKYDMKSTASAYRHYQEQKTLQAQAPSSDIEPDNTDAPEAEPEVEVSIP